MNRLSLRWNTETHKKAVAIPFTEAQQKVFCGGDLNASQKARAQAVETLKKRNAYNEQVKQDLGIEFEYRYLGLQASEYDPSWYGDTWQVTGKGDFSLTFRQGVGNRICFWQGYAAVIPAALIVPPSAMDILYCVYLDNPHDASFESWCSELGYDTDSCRAEKIYRACIDQTMMFRRNYPGVNLDEYEPLQEF